MGQQALIDGCSVLGEDISLSAVLLKAGGALQLTLVRQVELPSPDVLVYALFRSDVATALSLLGLPRLKDLNYVEPTAGLTVLHKAALGRLEEVGIAVLRRPDFWGVNFKTAPAFGGGAGATALHLAAASGLPGLCQSIVQHPDFTELLAELEGEGQILVGGMWVQFRPGNTAADIAIQSGHRSIFQWLQQKAGAVQDGC